MSAYRIIVGFILGMSIATSILMPWHSCEIGRLRSRVTDLETLVDYLYKKDKAQP